MILTYMHNEGLNPFALERLVLENLWPYYLEPYYLSAHVIKIKAIIWTYCNKYRNPTKCKCGAGGNQHKTANMAEWGYSKILSSFKAIKNWQKWSETTFPEIWKLTKCLQQFRESLFKWNRLISARAASSVAF